MDWNVIAQYLPLYEKAAWLTLRLGLAGIALAIVTGLTCARDNKRQTGSGLPFIVEDEDFVRVLPAKCRLWVICGPSMPGLYRAYAKPNSARTRASISRWALAAASLSTLPKARCGALPGPVEPCSPKRAVFSFSALFQLFQPSAQTSSLKVQSNQ